MTRGRRQVKAGKVREGDTVEHEIEYRFGTSLRLKRKDLFARMARNLSTTPAEKEAK